MTSLLGTAPPLDIWQSAGDFRLQRRFDGIRRGIRKRPTCHLNGGIQRPTPTRDTSNPQRRKRVQRDFFATATLSYMLQGGIFMWPILLMVWLARA